MLESFVEAGLELLMKENIVSISVRQLTWFVNEKCYFENYDKCVLESFVGAGLELLYVSFVGKFC